MKKKRICFIAQFPPPIHGLSKAVDTLYNSSLQNEFEFEKIDLTNNKDIIKNLLCLWRSKADTFYFTISQTKGGNIRDLIILKLLNFRKKKCIVHLHGGYYRKLVDNELCSFQRKCNYKTIKKLAGVIVLSNSLKNNFQGMIEDNKIWVIPNCVDSEFQLSSEEFEEKLKLIEEKKELRVLYLSNFIKTKGYHKVLELARLEKERCDKSGEKKVFHFDFAGKFFLESEKQFFDDYIKEHNLQGFVSYHGIVGGTQKKELFKNSDFFILLTQYPNEGQPISILEAMSNGMVIVTTDHAGIPDLVKNDENGIVCYLDKRYDSKNLYETLLRYNINKRREINIKNREMVIQFYTEKRYLEDMKSIFRLI